MPSTKKKSGEWCLDFHMILVASISQEIKVYSQRIQLANIEYALGGATNSSFKSLFQTHPGAGFSDTTHLDERDHVAQGFVHLLQSVLPLLG